MAGDQSHDPLHGITLEQILIKLEDKYGWEGLSARIDINCFKDKPSIKSSLKFLRKTPWARTKVESLYVMAFYQNNRPKTRGGQNTGAKAKQASTVAAESNNRAPIKARSSADPWGTKSKDTSDNKNDN